MVGKGEGELRVMAGEEGCVERTEVLSVREMVWVRMWVCEE